MSDPCLHEHVLLPLKYQPAHHCGNSVNVQLNILEITEYYDGDFIIGVTIYLRAKPKERARMPDPCVTELLADEPAIPISGTIATPRARRQWHDGTEHFIP